MSKRESVYAIKVGKCVIYVLRVSLRMAIDLSSGCNEAIEVLDEREEGEISLEDVSSSEEGHLSYGYGNKTGRCINCLSTQHCTSWCTSTKYYHPKSSNRKDTVQEKENRHYAKDSGSAGIKHSSSTLQEKNDDLVPISSDSDMEIVGLMDNSKQIHSLSRSRSKKKKKKERTHGSSINDDFVSSSSIDITAGETTLKHDNDNSKGDRLSRSHRRDLSPLHRSVRSRLSTKSPSRRYRASMWFKLPLRKSKSPVMRSRSPVLRRSPHRSPHRSSTRTISKKMSKNEQLPSSNACTDNVYGNVNKLLKKIRHIDSVRIRAQEGNIKNKEHCSTLKEKLSNTMKGMSDNNGNVTNCTKEKTVTCVEMNNDADDEEDLALLRQKALETKQKRNDKNNEQSKTELENKIATYDDDHNEEDLELRMIALRSAVLKKYQNEVQRSVKTKRYDSSTISHSKSPFTQSFLDSNIPIPSEKRVETPPVTQMFPALNENTHTEDMELDTDIEQEKEKLPYSPTDNITIDIPLDTELLGIQPSDVSFINLNKISSPPFDNTNNQLEHRAVRTGIIENKSYLSNMMNNTSTENTFYDMNPDAPYSPSDSIETSKSDVIVTKPCHESISTSQFNDMHCNMMNDISTNETCIAMDISTGQERPYSPTDAPIYDLDLSQTLPLIQTSHFSNNSNLTSTQAMYDTYGNSNILNMHEKSQLQYSATGENVHKEIHVNEVESFITRKQINSPHFFDADSISPIDSMLTIDDIPNTDVIKPSTPISASLNSENTESMLNNPIHKITKIAEEPLYMHGVPDVTKDINKIPTLINRTLVPATILKSNKQLQQPLPIKKHENHVEPTFKSAEMQPIPIDFNINTKLSTQFKPMKLTSVIKKPQTILTTPIAFQSCLNDESTSNVIEDAFVTPSKEHETSSLKNISLVNSKKAVFINNIDLVPKKKKRTRRFRRRNNVTQNINIKTSSENVEKSEHDSGAPGETNKTMMNTESGLPCSDIHEKQKNISDATVLADFDNVKLTKLSQESNSLLILDENSGKNSVKSKASFSCNEIQKDNIVQHSTNLESNISSSLKIINDHIAVVTNRRPSLDEDEEALRASLLASLAKRTKSLDTNSCNASLITTTATLSCVSTVPSMQKTQQMDTGTPPLTHQTVQNDTTLHSLTQSASAYNSGDEKNHTYTVPVSSADVKENSIGISTDTSSCSLLINSSKKRPLPLLKGPSKKFLKKVLIPASTKVVNNAKKYQNAVVQKRLILQKAISNYNAEKLIDIKPIASVKSCENKWTGNTKIISSDTQRIVINLGSDTESDSEHERLKAIPMSNSNKLEKRPILTIPTTEFEKSVDQFLRDVRKKQETAAANKQTIPLHNVTKKNLSSVTSAESKISPTVHTPLAVRHLPVSKQEEYRRLKQQILEREILKLQRSVEIGTSKKINNFNTLHSITSDNSSKESLPSYKENPNVLGKFSNLNLQISVKNNNERNIEVKKNKNSSTSSTILNSADKTNFGKQSDANVISNSKKGSLQIILNPNVRISNEEASNQNNKKLKTTESNVALIDTPKSVSENTMGLQETGKSKITTASLKVLTKDEVNHRLVQIQVKQHEPDQVIIIDNKTDLSERTDLVHNKNKQGIDANKDEDKICIEPDQDLTKQYNEMDKTNNLNTNCIFTEKDEKEADVSQNEIIIDDINSSSMLNMKLSIEHENVQNKKTTEKNQLLVTSVQDKVEDNTNLNLSNIESSNESDLLTSNKIETNKVANVEELNESITKDVTIELNSLVNLPKMEQVRHLMETEHKLVMKRYMVLDNLAEMSGDLRQWDMERDLQTNFVEEVKKLREQLKIAEEKLRIHRNRINSIGPKVMDAHEKINNGRRECFKLSRICKVLGSKVVGQDYKVPQAGADLLDNKLKEVASHTRQLSKKKVPSIHISEVYEEVVPLKKESGPKPIESEIPEFEKSFTTEQQNDNHNENNNMIALKDEDNILTSMNTQVSSDQEDEEDGRDISSCETNDTIKHDHYYNRTTTEVVSCVNNNPANKEDCDITQCIETGEIMLKEDNYQKKKTIEPYVSMLSHLKVARNANPNGVLCPYELMGTCNDGDCQFVHQSVMFCSHHMERNTLGIQDYIDPDAVHSDDPSRSNARRW
ncbi:uncharacterized protein LOC118446562 isoform X3 [Vespa mandarinia]|nr:uncharacterized protein LOC118446562 isoform X3 [Vespa mandarinia]